MANFKLADKETLRKYLEILKRIKRREMSNANKINLIDSDIAIMETILELPMCESSSENESMDELNSILLELLYTFLNYDGFYRKLIFENRFSYTSESLIALADYFLLVKDFEKYDSSIKTDDFRKLLIDYLNEELLDSDQDASTLTDEELIAHYNDYYLDTDVITDLGYLIGLLKSLELLPIIIDDKKRGMKILKRELNLKQNCNIVDPQKFKDNVNNLRL